VGYLLIAIVLAYAAHRVVRFLVNWSRAEFSIGWPVNAGLKWLLADLAYALGLLPIVCIGYALWTWTAFSWLVALVCVPASSVLQRAFVGFLRVMVREFNSVPCRELLEEILESNSDHRQTYSARVLGD
jgi:hypothetical protein